MKALTFAELLACYERATPADRQRVLDLVPEPNDLYQWDAALREVFGTNGGEFGDRDMGSDGFRVHNRMGMRHRSHDCDPAPIELTDQGWNLILPGTERSTHQAVKARGEKIRPKATQREPGGMFEPRDARTLDLFR